jgi:hypothetical protein
VRCMLKECGDEIKGSGVLFISAADDELIIDWTGVHAPQDETVTLVLHPGCWVSLFKEVGKQDRMIAGQFGDAPIEIIESELGGGDAPPG